MRSDRRAGVVEGTLLLLLLLLVTGTQSQNCGQLITTENELVGNNVIIQKNGVMELTAVDSELLKVSWVADTFSTPQPKSGVDTVLGETHLKPTVDEENLQIVVSVKQTMEGLPDYPQSVTELRLVYVFPLLDTTTITECTVTMLFNLVDQNTAKPTTDKTEYTASVREDFPEQLTIPGLQVMAGDVDGRAPNNELSVSMDPSCPLGTEKVSYSPVNGVIPITFVLKTKLDFDTIENPVMVCTATLKDGGTEPSELHTEFTVTLTVLPYDDEPPVFENPFYNCKLEAMEAPSVPLKVLPATLLAIDPDKPPLSVTYLMVVLKGEDPKWEAYFRLDGDSGEVYQEQDFTEELLADEYSIHFVVTATDSSGAEDTTVLEIILPPAPTTTNSTTTTRDPGTGSTTTVLTSSSSSGATSTGSTSTGTTSLEPTATTPPATTTSSATTDGSLPPSTAGPSTTEPPTNPQYKFQLQAYHFQPFTDSTTVGTLIVLPVDETRNQPPGTVFSWDTENSVGSDNFLLEESTGTISLAKTDMDPGEFSLVAMAVVDGQTVTTDVYISVIIPLKCGDMFVSPGVVIKEISEYDGPNKSIANIQVDAPEGGEYKFCITVTPTAFNDSFQVDSEGEVSLMASIDADTAPEYIHIRVKATSNDDPCVISTGGDLTRSEALILLKVRDENDEPPVILSPQEGSLLAYPTNRGLQQVVGPVTTLQVQDVDDATVLEFGLSDTSSDSFLVDDTTGELFLSNSDACDTQCEVTVTVSDGEHDVQRSFEIHRLDIAHIHDLSLGSMSTTEVKNYIQTLSEDTKLDLHLLYTSMASSATARVFTSVSSAEGRLIPRHSFTAHNHRGEVKQDEDDEGEWTTVAHIYGFDESGNLIDLQTLNSALTDAGEDLQAAVFSEKDTFDPAVPDDPSVVGYQVAVGVLGGLLGLLLVAAVVGYVMFRKKSLKHDHKSNGPAGVSTIGSAYPNHAYEHTELNMMDSDSTKSSISGTNKKQETATSASTGTELFPKTTNVVNTTSSPYEGVTAIVSPADVTTTSIVGGGTMPLYASREPPLERTSSQHSLSGLRRIDPGPSPDGVKSSPYLSSSDGDFTTSRSSNKDNVPSFTAYKGGPLDSADFVQPYSPVYKSGGYSSAYGSDMGRRDDRAKDTKETSKHTKIDTSPYAFPVRTKKEPPNLSSAAPAKPIMKPNKESGTVSTSAEVHNSADATLSSSTYSRLRGSPSPKAKKKDDSDEKKSNLKANMSDSETTDSEVKKSVAFKVLVDQKEIKRREEVVEEEEETEDL